MPFNSLIKRQRYEESLKQLPKYCLNCSKFYLASIYKPNSKYCCKRCQNIHSAKESSALRGDLQRGKGNKTYIKFRGQHLHRYTMEQSLGRELTSDEIVHHIDGNKFNNNIKNLQIVTREEHARIHATKNRKCQIKNCFNKHSSKGYCRKHYDKIIRER